MWCDDRSIVDDVCVCFWKWQTELIMESSLSLSKKASTSCSVGWHYNTDYHEFWRCDMILKIWCLLVCLHWVARPMYLELDCNQYAVELRANIASIGVLLFFLFWFWDSVTQMVVLDMRKLDGWVALIMGHTYGVSIIFEHASWLCNYVSDAAWPTAMRRQFAHIRLC